MYCRECGNQIPDNSLRCPDCGTKAGEGISYCQNCGNLTSIKTEFCFHCGAKQKNIMTQKMKNAQLAELQKRAKFNKKLMKIEKFIAVAGIIIAVILIAVLVLRPEPDNIPEISVTKSGYSIYGPNYTSRLANDDVQEYWKQGRELVGNTVLCLFLSISSFIAFLIQKSAYKQNIKAIKEAKNVL